MQDQRAQRSLPGQRGEIERLRAGIGGPLEQRQALADEREKLRGLSVPDHGEERAAGAVAAGVEGERVLALEGLHVALVAVRGMPVRMVRAVAEHDHRARRHAARLVQIALQRGQGAAPGCGDLVLGKGRLEGHFQQRIQRLPGQVHGDRQRERGLVERHLDAEPGPHALDELVHAAGVPLERAAPEQVGGELGQAGLVARILGCAGRHGEPDVEERDSAPLDGDQGEPGGLARGLQRGQRDVAGHASAPSGSSPGTSVTRLRRCGAKVRFATRCTSAGVIAW